MKLTDKLKMGALATALAVTSGCASAPRVPGPNKVVVDINSEPRVARVYISGKYWCNTPCKLEYDLNSKHYNRGLLSLKEITVAKDGYLPKTERFIIEIPTRWRNVNDKKFLTSELFLLDGDPRYTYNINNNTSNNKTEIINKDSGLRELNNGIDALYKYKILRQMSK